ncbi:DotU family type IV/VI secretion system protein [Allofrancisella guangzhouensis]|uniref:Type IV / VI secretion system DotU domain-containing protein n=1 Tax=Allofrancisella guangzhouensis TaxID=594679 RepID=A0A0A8E2C9_9GAMM|nr:DotU family type IV/VI secretion system protein [Allofrancisella guangzhouensis]AJC48375.1 hypothetical protein SD28_01220 [Allofrancisella guangzhouensis]MBK2026678.1 DotU family type IV/VI secretion system protein [Allofrancisella guangzhouensis]MBK2044165.1 DotU family type IV/VI secretion system protein [Allofrancisella guangzhouensis]MBK2045515.1 DotU family type IV/VI secretion system protein [Allofrancisella guangzhouensis]
MHQDIIEIFITINFFIENYNSDTQMQDTIAFRDEIITKTNNIHNTVYQEHGERASFYIAFAIYSYCDEMVNKINFKTDSGITNWHLLQEEVYQRNDGGDYFFEIVESILDNPVFPKVVAQVLYLILALGFKGCYIGLQTEIDKYKNKLSVILPDQDVGDINFPTFNSPDSKFRKTYKTRLFRGIFLANICFPIFAYFGILLIR